MQEQHHHHHLIVCLKVPPGSIVAWFSTHQQNFDLAGFKAVFKYTVRSSTMITMPKQSKQQGILNDLKAIKQYLQVTHYADFLSTYIHVLHSGADSNSNIKAELDSSASDNSMLDSGILEENDTDPLSLLTSSVTINYLLGTSFLLCHSYRHMFLLGLCQYLEDRYVFSLGPQTFSLAPFPQDTPTPVPLLLFVSWMG